MISSRRSAPMIATRVSFARRSVRRSRPSGRGQLAEWNHILSEELFRDALLRERKRADRFEEPFVLVLISLDERARHPPHWAHLVKALSQRLDADVIGWYEQGSVLGFVRSLADRDPKHTASAVAGAIRRQLARSLTPDNMDCCSIRLEVYSPRGDSIPPVLAGTRNERRRPQG